nr:AraC family transcriptional regulator [Ochrobactrum sp. Marseille-Q0166]
MTDVTSSQRFVADLAPEPPKAQVDHSSLPRRDLLAENVEDADVGQKPNGHKFIPAQQKKILAYVNSRLSQPITVRELSALVNLSASHFSRKFKLTFGDPPCTWLLSRRLKHARKLIAEDEAPLKVIAAEAGFADQSHMTRAFQSFVGLTPGSYRQQLALPSNDRDLAKSGRV